MDIYDRIDACLEKHRKTKMEMCKSIGLSYNTLMSCYRRRTKKIPIETIRQMSLYLGCSLDYLITGTEINVSSNDNAITNNSGNAIITNISNNNVHTVKVSNKDLNLSEIEFEVLRVMNRLPTKQRNELLNMAYELEQKNRK